MLNPLTETLMAAKCPECHGSIFVKVGLAAQPGDNVVRCPSCNNHVAALVPGLILGGPYAAPE
jgi:predicted Zn finger-like uncharacterized protein